MQISLLQNNFFPNAWGNWNRLQSNLKVKVEMRQTDLVATFSVIKCRSVDEWVFACTFKKIEKNKMVFCC